jgi:pimeloyl-ACP methyl ester carboxylesterase
MNRVACLASAMLLAAVALAGTITRAADEELQTIPTRPGVTQSFLLVKPTSPPAASLILFPGPDRLALSDRGIGEGKNNFLVRTRSLFADRGFLVAVVDAPSDRGSEGLTNFRTSQDHARDIAAVALFLRQRADAPVWLVGTCMGTLSAANVAARAAEGLSGLVLTSSRTRSSRAKNVSLQDVRLQDIALPTLLVHNKSDACRVTPYTDIPALMRQLKRAPKVELLTFEGGDPPRSEPCEALSYHGYLGIEPAVVDAIARWIMATSGGG